MTQMTTGNEASIHVADDDKGMATWLAKVTAWVSLPAIALILVMLCWAPILDSAPEIYVDESLSRALKVYGAARAVNAVVSVAQEVSVLGVPIGQLLDPLNDLVERFSILMEISIVSLVVQKLLVAITSDYFFKIAFTGGVGFLLFSIAFRRLNLSSVAYRLFLTLVFLRFSVAAMVIMSSYVDHIFLDAKINRETSAIITSIPTEKSPDPNQPKPCPWYNPLCKKNEDEGIKDKLEQMSPQAIKDKVEQMVPSLVSLMGVFFFNTIFLPILFIYSFKLIIGAIWGYQIPVIQRWKRVAG